MTSFDGGIPAHVQRDADKLMAEVVGLIDSPGVVAWVRGLTPTQFESWRGLSAALTMVAASGLSDGQISVMARVSLRPELASGAITEAEIDEMLDGSALALARLKAVEKEWARQNGLL